MELSQRVAFVIPSHPSHYTSLESFLDSFATERPLFDIYIVFSSEEDYQLFQKKDKIFPIICPVPSHIQKGIINYKKLYGLQTLQNSSYDYIICCDDEIVYLPTNAPASRLPEAFAAWFKSKTLFGGTYPMPILHKILEDSANLFSAEDQEILRQRTDNFKLYCWWSEPPVYRRTDLAEFFSMFDYSNITWHQFDHIIYQHYLVLRHGFTFVNIIPHLGGEASLEFSYSTNQQGLCALAAQGLTYVWCRANFFLQNKEYLQGKTLLVYHLDRDKKTPAHFL